MYGRYLQFGFLKWPLMLCEQQLAKLIPGSKKSSAPFRRGDAHSDARE